MKKSLIAFVTIGVTLLAGCAGTSGNDAYIKAHEAHADRAKTEANATAKAQETIALAIASAAKGCETDACRMGAMMTYANIKAQANAIVQSAAPAIAAPVNEALAWGKLLVDGGLGFMGLRVNLAKYGIEASRSVGAADKDVIREGMSYGNIINDNTTPVK